MVQATIGSMAEGDLRGYEAEQKEPDKHMRGGASLSISFVSKHLSIPKYCPKLSAKLTIACLRKRFAGIFVRIQHASRYSCIEIENDLPLKGLNDEPCPFPTQPSTVCRRDE